LLNSPSPKAKRSSIACKRQNNSENDLRHARSTWIRGSRLPVNPVDKMGTGTPIHLDTNCLIRFAGGASDKLSESILTWIGQGVSVQVSAMAWAEFRCGPLTEDDCVLVSEILTGVIPVDQEVSNEAAHLFNVTGRRSRSLADCIIAATAISCSAQLLTENTEDFQPFLTHGLQLA